MRRMFLALAAAAVAMLALPALAPAADTALTARLNGKNEAPAQGDKNGKGFATIILDSSSKQACFALSWNKIGPAILAHIHKGKQGVAGPVVVALFAGTAAKAGCVPIASKLLKAIRKKPGNYYVNVHSMDFPNGAIRGQLKVVK